MTKKFLLLALSLFLLVFLLYTDSFSQDAGTFSLNVKPGVFFPLGKSSDRFNIGGTLELNGDYVFPSIPLLYIHGVLDYSFLPTVSEETLKLLAVGAGAGLNLYLMPKMNIKLFGAGGYSLGMFKDVTSGNPLFHTGLDISYHFSPSFSLGAGTSYKRYFAESEALSQGIAVGVGGSYKFGAGNKRSNIEFRQIQILPVFPVFFKFYDNNPLGKVMLYNRESSTIRDVRVSLFVKQYMDSPKECAVIRELGKGEEREIPLYALFTEKVLNITEATKSQVEVVVEYSFLGNERSKKQTETVRLYDRNALTWDDDRKAAAFVTSKDPAVLRFSKNVAGLIRESGYDTINSNFRMALGLFEVLSLYEINYVVDPKTPYAELSKDTTSLDFVQFPSQTLEYRAGDCDDLSILYCALLESIGIETAFITLPGHIYAAFSLDMSPDEARRAFLEPDDLIFRDGKAWVPVEITMIREGFLKAWQRGARQWRENEPEQRAGFYPIHGAWEVYEPVGIVGGEAAASLPSSNQVVNRYKLVLNSFIEQEIRQRVSELRRQIERSDGDPRLINKLGVLYARYGLFEEAEKEFKKITEKKEYVPALANMGNIYLLKSDYIKALDYYGRAYKRVPNNPAVLVGLAKANYEIENYGNVKQYYQKLESIDSDIALKFSYLVSKDEGLGRASSQRAKEAVEWDEE